MESVRGMRPLDGSQIIIDSLKLKRDAEDVNLMTAEELLAETEIQLNARWGEVQMMPGAARLLAHLKRHKVPTALATSTPSKYLRVKMASHEGVLEGFDVVCTGDEVTNGKPAPDIFTLAADRFKVEEKSGGVLADVEPARCLVVEDTPLGVEAAKAAGMIAVAVPSIQNMKLYEGADEIARSLLDFDPSVYGLPPFDDWVPNPTEGLDPVLPLDPPVRMGGPVVKGFGRGSKVLGIPTANLDVGPLKYESDSLAPGIYFGWAGLKGSQGGVYAMVMSIGWNPFFDNSSKTIEPWLLHEFPEDFYHQELRLTVMGYVRPEANFTTLDALIERIHRDGDVARAMLKSGNFEAFKEDAYLVDDAVPLNVRVSEAASPTAAANETKENT